MVYGVNLAITDQKSPNRILIDLQALRQFRILQDNPTAHTELALNLYIGSCDTPHKSILYKRCAQPFNRGSRDPTFPLSQSTGRTLLFHYAACGDDEHVERLLNANWEAAPVDCTGLTPLHLAAAAGHSMVAYLLASKAYAACRVLDGSGLTPADTAAAAKKGEVLNNLSL